MMSRMRTPSLRTASVVVALLASGALVACSDDGDEASSGTTAATGAGSASGEVLYAENCASCHGADLRGTDKGPPHLDPVYAPGHHGDDSFRQAIASGSVAHHWDFGDMPPVEGLTDDEVDAIIAFVRERQAAEGIS